MVGAIAYLGQRFLYRIFEFVRHWYVKSLRIYTNFLITKLEQLDYYIAWKITLRNIFEPLYKDYSILGYILGFIFRSLRLLMGTFIYAIIFSLAAFCYLIWLATPFYIVFKIFS